jgi:hypothetical protein
MATALSLAGTMRACERSKIELHPEGPVGCSAVTWARDVVAAHFLKSDCDLLFWIDADIAWAPKDFLRLVAAATMQYDVIGGTYPFKSDPPCIVVNTPDPEHLEVNGHGNVRVKGLGLGFTCVKRAVMERLAATKGKITIQGIECPDMFRLDKRASGEGLGEDIAFFEDLVSLGYKIWLDPSVQLDHIGVKAYRGDPIAALGLAEFAKETAV